MTCDTSRSTVNDTDQILLYNPIMRISKEFIILITAILLLILTTNFPIVSDPRLYYLNYWAYLFLVPIAILLASNERLTSFGFKKPKWPFRFSLTLVGAFLILAMVYSWSLLPEFQEYYLARIPKDNVIAFILVTLGSYYFAEEFFFRGFLLFSLTKKFGSWAIVIQAIPFALFHLGKPTLEIICALFVGLLFGHIAYKTKSFFYPFLIHWGIGVVLVILIAS